MARARDLATKLIYESFLILKENDGELLGKEVINQVSQRVELDEWALEKYEISGYIRWQSLLHFFTIDCVKAGFMRKKKAIWFLTSEGEEAIKLGPEGLLDKATFLYRKWRKANPKENEINNEKQNEIEDEIIDSKSQEITIDQIEQMAISSIKSKIQSKNPYEFQDLVAALLRGMGYFTPFVAPKGPDGGFDVVAYRDPLGTIAPRIKVQVKHRKDKSSVTEIRQLMGLLQKDGDVGMFISTGGFTPDAKRTAQSSHVHVELIDIERFISLWQDFYTKMDDEDKAFLPLLPFYFHAEID